MPVPVVMALDVGTSSVRTVVLALPHARIAARFALPMPEGDRLGVSAEAVWERVAAVLDQAEGHLAETATEAVACGVSMFWHSMLLTSASSRPLGRLRLWSDDDPLLAGAARSLRAAVDAEAIRRAVGAPIHPSFPSVKAFAAHLASPAAEWSGVRVGGFEDLLALRLFGRWEKSLSMASATGLWDAERREWHGGVLAALGLTAQQLPAVERSPDETRRLSAAARRRWPRLAAATWRLPRGDGALSNLGLGATGLVAALTIGTSSALRLCAPSGATGPLPHALFRYALDSDRPVVGGALSAGGNLLAWAADRMGVRPNAVEGAAASLAPGAGGVLVLPGLWGERSPDWPDATSGGIVGLRASSSPAEVVRAAMDAVGAGLWSIADGLDQLFGPGSVNRVRAGGKAVARSAALAQVAADALGRPLDIVAGADESSALGAALAALESVGLPAPPRRRVLRTYLPRPGRRQAYRELAERQAQVRRLLADPPGGDGG